MLMEIGYAFYFHGGRGYAQQNWYPGEPEPSFWTGLAVKKDQCVPITTLRCPNCTFLSVELGLYLDDSIKNII
jgi:hypothetical protein